MISWVSAGCCFMASRSRHHYVPNDYLQFFKVTSVHLQPRARYQQHFRVLFWGDFAAQHRWTLRSADSFNSSRYKYTQGQSLGKPLTHTLRQRGSLKYGKALPFKWHLRQNWSAAGRHEAWIFAKPWSLSVLGATPCFKHKQMNSLDTVPEANRDIETFISLDHRSIADKRPALNKFLLSVKFWDQQGFFTSFPFVNVQPLIAEAGTEVCTRLWQWHMCLFVTVCTLKAWPLCFSALPAGSAPGRLGAAAETDHPVFPDCRLCVHRTVESVWLQASLERRSHRTHTGRAHGSARGKSCTDL